MHLRRMYITEAASDYHPECDGGSMHEPELVSELAQAQHDLAFDAPAAAGTSAALAGAAPDAVFWG